MDCCRIGARVGATTVDCCLRLVKPTADYGWPVLQLVPYCEKPIVDGCPRDFEGEETRVDGSSSPIEVGRRTIDG